MEKSIYSPLYEVFRLNLVAMRKAANLTQRQLAARLKRVWSIVANIELGERRVDVVELYWISKACGVDPGKTFAEVAKALSGADRTSRTKKR